MDAVSLFSGAGGLDVGVRQAGFSVKACVELDANACETMREYLRIHGYPDDYLLKGPIRSRTGRVKNLDQHRQVANSVPPSLAFAMAKAIANYLNQEEPLVNKRPCSCLAIAVA